MTRWSARSLCYTGVPVGDGLRYLYYAVYTSTGTVHWVLYSTGIDSAASALGQAKPSSTASSVNVHASMALPMGTLPTYSLPFEAPN
jgi:hypothetical protein